MHKALNAYEQNAKVTQSPRELEASLLLKAASQLQYIADNWRDNWGKENNEFLAALYYNRRLLMGVLERSARAVTEAVTIASRPAPTEAMGHGST